MNVRRKVLRAGVALAAAAAGLVPALHVRAQAWPSRPVRIVVPFPPGGSGDSVARIIGQALALRLGQPVVIDNKPGANLFLGAQEVARAQPDGYTLLLAHDSIFTVNPYAFARLPYDPAKDFSPVSLVSTAPLWFAASPKLKVGNMAELIALAARNPGKINYGSGALVARLGGEYLKALTGAQMTYIPYKGSGPAVQALLAGEIDVVVADPTPFIPFAADPRIVLLGQTSTSRSAPMAQVPTMVEQGIRGLVVNNWFAIFAPTSTPVSVVQRLNTELNQISTQSEIKARLSNLGVESRAGTIEDLQARTKEDAQRWARVIKDAGIKLID